jgi:peptidoglycan/LPS O-acetylase OafA/YrhL
MRKLDYIDALRGLAILGVIIVHTDIYGTSNLSDFFKSVVVKGQSGVQLFFIASAFTLFYSFRNRVTTELSPVRNFFIRRFFRIVPLYYIAITYYLIKSDALIPPGAIFANITFLHAFHPSWISSIVPGGWSIGVEMTFYLALPFLFFRIKNINQAFIFFMIALVVRYILFIAFMKTSFVNESVLWQEYMYLYFPSQLPLFALGIIMYFIICEGQLFNKISGKSILLFSAMILAQLVTGIDLMPTQVRFGLGFLVLGIALSRFKFKLIVNPVINYIGKISFSMYFIHFAVLHWLTVFKLIDYAENGVLNYILKLSVVILLTVLFSSATYYLVEVPFQKLGKKFISWLEKKDTQPRVTM